MRGAMKKLVLPGLLLLLMGALSACADDGAEVDDTDPPPVVEFDQPFTSSVATLLDFEFDASFNSTSVSNIKGQVRTQLLYSIGQINGEHGTSWLNKLVVSNTAWRSLGGGLYGVTYHAKLPVAWGSKSNLPTSYQLVLPKRIDQTGQNGFTSKYGQVCNDGDDASVMVANYWYHYRPKASGCSLADADVVRANATLTVNTANMVAKYPEYHRVWEDGALNVVAIFGKYEKGATSDGDAGISAYNSFVAAVKRELPGATTKPANVSDNPGAANKEVSFKLSRADGTIVTIVAMLTDELASEGTAFNTRYSELTPGADLILYNGHAGLGKNVAALATKGTFFPGKYQIFYFNGCDTFSYVDDTLAKTRAVLNASDPTGTKFMDTVTNAMPAYFVDMSDGAMAFIRAMLNHTTPQTYTQILGQIDNVQIAVTTGEEDNVFWSGYDPGTTWNGFDASGAVGKSQTVTYQTEVLSPGKYVFTTVPDPMLPGGDADLRVRVGAAPTITSTYKCPSYRANSNEQCSVTITTPQKVYLAVTGDKTGVSSAYYVHAWQQ
jgi:hypothetical protein